MNKTAILLGATGVTGSAVLQLLLQDVTFATIKVFTRKPLTLKHPKIIEYVGDVVNIDSFSSDFTADVVFCCIGTTKAHTPDENLYHAIDFGIPVKAAKLSEENKIATFLVVSAMGANAKSSLFYSKTKGEMEQAVLNCNIPNIGIVRPSLIATQRKEIRFGEGIANAFMKIMNPLFIGSLKKYRSIKPEVIAKALLILSVKQKGKSIYNSDEIAQIGR